MRQLYQTGKGPGLRISPGGDTEGLGVAWAESYGTAWSLKWLTDGSARSFFTVAKKALDLTFEIYNIDTTDGLTRARKRIPTDKGQISAVRATDEEQNIKARWQTVEDLGPEPAYEVGLLLPFRDRELDGAVAHVVQRTGTVVITQELDYVKKEVFAFLDEFTR